MPNIGLGNWPGQISGLLLILNDFLSTCVATEKSFKTVHQLHEIRKRKSLLCSYMLCAAHKDSLYCRFLLGESIGSTGKAF